MRKKRVHSQMTIDAQIQQLQLMMSEIDALVTLPKPG